MATTIGTIQLIATIDTSRYKKGANDINKTNSDLEKSSDKTSNSISSGFSKAAKVGLAAATVATVTLGAALTKAATASWQQVSAVEQATVGLRAYEKDGSKVNAVLSDLIKFARSDMGVLFNRKDLFQSAQMLKLNGVQTQDLSKNVQILSRSVGLGLGNWQDLNSVVGRVVATGRLSGIEFDQLTQYGFKLDKSLRNTNITTEKFFQTLDKGIPVDALAGQATTIRGLGIRIESAFRGIGDAILGVDADTSKFIKGGLGDLIVQFMDRLPKALKTVQPYVKQFGDFITSTLIPGIISISSDISKYLEPSFKALGNSIKNILPVLKTFISTYIVPTAQALGGALVVGIRLAVSALNTLVSILNPLIRWLNNNRSAVIGLSAALGTLYTALKIRTGIIALQAALITLRMGFIASTVATIGFSGALGALSTAVKVFIAGLGPVGWAITGITLLMGVLAAVTSNNKSASDRLKTANDNLKQSYDNLKLASDSYKNAQLGLEGAQLNLERAQRSYNEAVKQYGPASLEAREALFNMRQSEFGVKQAQDEVKKSSAELKKQQDETSKNEEVMKALQRQSDAFQLTAEQARDAAKATREFVDANISASKKSNSVSPSTKAGINALNAIQGRASGGPVSANRPYFVGENPDGSLNKTSELFVPGSSGRIMNSSDLQAALSGKSAGSKGDVFNITVQGTFATSKAEQRRVAETIAKRIQEVKNSKSTIQVTI